MKVLPAERKKLVMKRFFCCQVVIEWKQSHRLNSAGTFGIRLLLVLAMLGISLFAASRLHGQAASDDRESRIEVKFDITSSIDGTVIKELDIGELKRGTRNRVFLDLTNKLVNPFAFLGASVACNCISTKIPQISLAADAHARLEFEFVVGLNEKKIQKSFGVEIRTAGSVDRVVLTFKARISGVVAFPEDEMVHDVRDYTDGTDPEKIIVLPLVVSDVALLSDASISVSEELFGKVSAQLVRNDKSPQLELRFKAIKMTEDNQTGVVSLHGTAFANAELKVTLRRRKPIQVLPGTLVFGSKNDAMFSSSAIVKVRSGEPSIDMDLVVECYLPNRQPIKSSLSQLSRGIYRIEIEVPKSFAEEFRKSNPLISMQFQSPTAEKSLDLDVVSRFLW